MNPSSVPRSRATRRERIAKDPSKPLPLRLTAVRAIRNHTSFYANVKAALALISLIPDSSRDIRAAVAEVTVLHGGYDARTRAEKATFERLYKDARQALTRQFAAETDPTALAAIASALEAYPNTGPLPPRAAAPALAGRVEIFQDELRVSITCLHTGAILRDPKLVVLRDGKPVSSMMPSTIYTRCDDRAGDARAGTPLRLAPGHYTLSVDLDLGGKRTLLDLGALDSLADGELALVRP